MRIEFKDKKTFWGPFWNGIGFALLVYIIMLCLLLGIFYTTYHEISDPENLFELNEINYNINSWFYKWGIIIGLILLAGTIFVGNLNLIFRERCLVCGKWMYPDADDVVVLNPKEVKKEATPRIVCLDHKKPYCKPIKNNWKDVKIGEVE